MAQGDKVIVREVEDVCETLNAFEYIFVCYFPPCSKLHRVLTPLVPVGLIYVTV